MGSPVVMRRQSWSLKKLQQKRGQLYLGKTLPHPGYVGMRGNDRKAMEVFGDLGGVSKVEVPGARGPLATE